MIDNKVEINLCKKNRISLFWIVFKKGYYIIGWELIRNGVKLFFIGCIMNKYLLSFIIYEGCLEVIEIIIYRILYLLKKMINEVNIDE